MSKGDKIGGVIMALAIAGMVYASGTRDNFQIISQTASDPRSLQLYIGGTLAGFLNGNTMDFWNKVGGTDNAGLNVYGIRDGGVGDAMYSQLSSDNSGIDAGTKYRWDSVNFGQLKALLNLITNLNLSGSYVSLNQSDGKLEDNKLTFYDSATSINTNCAIYGLSDSTLVIDAKQVDCSGKKVVNVARGTLSAE